MCEYEILRVGNIREREEAMAASKFFDNLISYKSEIGFYKGEEKLESSIEFKRKIKKKKNEKKLNRKLVNKSKKQNRSSVFPRKVETRN